MTSKEALEHLGRINLGDNRYCNFEDDLLKNCCKEEYEKIEKDLEILEMLKKKMTIETDYCDNGLGCEIFEYIAFNGETLYIDSQEEFDLLKEWLEK